MNEPHDRWIEQLRDALQEHADRVEAVAPWAPPTEHRRIGRHPWRWLTPLAAAAAVLLIVAGVEATRLSADHGIHPASPTAPKVVTSTVAPSTTSTAPTVSTSAAGPTVASSARPTASPPPPDPTAPSVAPTPPTTRLDAFAQVTGATGPLVLRSAVTGAVLRTLVPATGDTAPGGDDFAEVGPSGRYIYYTDGAGAARVPVGGGPVQQLPAPQNGGLVSSVFADRSDTRFEEAIGYFDDSKPSAVYVARLGSAAFTSLGSGTLEQAAGWNPAGTMAYVITFPSAGERIIGTPLAGSGTRVQQTLPCGATAAVGPSGQIGWVVVSGCHSTAVGQLIYTARSATGQPLASATLPPQKAPFYEDTLHYTPAGTAVLFEPTPDSSCGVDYPVAVVHVRSNRGVDLPGANPRCR